MRKRVLWLCVAAAWMVLTSCQAAQPTATPVPPTAAPQPQAGVQLEVTGPEGTQVLTLDQIKEMSAAEGWAGTKNSVGKVTPAQRHKGVAIEELCKLVGGMTPQQAVSIVAEDGYAMTLSYDQAINGDLVTYDPISGDEIEFSDPLQVILAYERDGEPLDANSEGSLRAAMISPSNNQVTDGHWAVKWVRQVVIKPAAE